MSDFVVETPAVTMSRTADAFSLLGGPLHRWGQRLGLVRGRNTVRLGLALGFLPWSVLLVLTIIEGAAQNLFSLSVIAGDLRLLLVIPLFFLCESTLDPRMNDFVLTILRSGVVPPTELPAFGSEVERIIRLRDSFAPEILCLVAAALASVFAAELQLSGKTSALESGRAVADLPLAGLWYWSVCLPLFRFLMFRWFWRIALWWRFLWRIARLNLHLAPSHPDGAGGLGYLEVVQSHFISFALAISVIVSASFAEEISTGKSVFEVIYPAVALTLILDLVLVLGPPCVFAVKLRACQEKGLSDYTIFASRYVNEFDRKWLDPAAKSEEPLLGTADLQSLADLANSVGIVRHMRWAPLSTRLSIAVIVATLLPMAPLLLFKYPIEELALKLFNKLAGL